MRDLLFVGKIESWPYAPINDVELVAGAIRRDLGIEPVRKTTGLRKAAVEITSWLHFRPPRQSK